jgi:hypothetical protein
MGKKNLFDFVSSIGQTYFEELQDEREDHLTKELGDAKAAAREGVEMVCFLFSVVLCL